MARPKAPSGLRKIVLGVGFVLVGVLVDSFSGNGLSNNLLSLLLYVYASFCAGNGIEHVAGALSKKKAVDFSAVEAKLANIEAQTATNQQALGVILQAIPAAPQQPEGPASGKADQ